MFINSFESHWKKTWQNCKQIIEDVIDWKLLMYLSIQPYIVVVFQLVQMWIYYMYIEVLCAHIQLCSTLCGL